MFQFAYNFVEKMCLVLENLEKQLKNLISNVTGSRWFEASPSTGEKVGA